VTNSENVIDVNDVVDDVFYRTNWKRKFCNLKYLLRLPVTGFYIEIIINNKNVNIVFSNSFSLTIVQTVVQNHRYKD